MQPTARVMGTALRLMPHVVEVRLARPNLADKHGRIGRLALGVCDGDRILVDVETDKKGRRLGHS